MKRTPAKKHTSAHSENRAVLDCARVMGETCFRERLDASTLEKALLAIRPAVPFNHATLLLTGTDGDWEKVVAIGETVEPLEFLQLGSGVGLSGWAAYSGKPILLADRTRSRHFNPKTDIASILSMPIPECDSPIGVLNLGADKPGNFTAGHIEILETLSQVLAPILERLSCERKLAIAIEELETTRTRLKAAEERVASGGVGALAGTMIAHVHEINEQLSIIIGNIDCLLVTPIESNQGTLTRLRRAEEAAVKLRACGRKLLKLTQPRKQTVNA